MLQITEAHIVGLPQNIQRDTAGGQDAVGRIIRLRPAGLQNEALFPCDFPDARRNLPFVRFCEGNQLREVDLVLLYISTKLKMHRSNWPSSPLAI